MAEFPKSAAEQAHWWERRILDVVHGLPPDSPTGASPRPEFDPKQQSLAQRERAKAAELTAAGHTVTASGIKQRRQRYQREGVLGLADGRSAKRMPAFGKVDPVVVEAMQQAIGESADASSRTIGFTVWRTKQILASREGAASTKVPSQRTLYRLFGKLAAGSHTTGSARTRRSVTLRPQGPFGEVAASAPGELMQIDSTPLDVLVRLDDGIAEKVELTAMIDIATRSITAVVLRPTTKAADASALLARSVTPAVMRPGWPDALRMARSALPHRRLLTLDERLEQAAARPVIVPETIVCDHGKVSLIDSLMHADLGAREIWVELTDHHDIAVLCNAQLLHSRPSARRRMAIPALRPVAQATTAAPARSRSNRQAAAGSGPLTSPTARPGQHMPTAVSDNQMTHRLTDCDRQ
ncbi:hypothetical protein [Streptomyces virginiae]|uniref:hypothetical protein n=1 Tax=Streptomyces virginiae TaxID=1961 RepID=UPI0036C647F6